MKNKIIVYKRGQHPNSIKNIEQRHIALRSMYTVNDNYFNTLNVENCYYGGFIAGDGCVIDKHLIISVQKRDKCILDSFAKALESTHPISEYLTKNKYPQCRTEIFSENILSDLYKYFNITPRKSLTLRSPNLTDHNLIDAYIKGIIDADGSIGLSEKYGIKINFIGTKQVCEFIIERFSEILKTKNKLRPHKIKNVYGFTISNISARKVFLHYYKIPLGLSRKWSEEKFIYCKNWKSKRINTQKCEEYYTLSKNYTIKQISEIKGCTYANVQMFFRSRMYREYIYLLNQSKIHNDETKMLDAEEVSIEDEESA